MRRTLATGAAGLLLLVGAAPGSAAPPHGELMTVHCDDGSTHQIWTSGNGSFTPGHLVGSTGVLVPISFSMTITATPPGEEPVLVEEGKDLKGGGAVLGHNPRPQVTCSFTDTFTLDVEEEGFPPGTVVTFDGEVVAHLSGR
ncbi:hypothetical protein [Ornithinimicrobium kibberense]|uniref:Uncharacterized protein n=1 Tax=Ornithinimicrobium kibberense TaxID=282060 RepID=A0ABV5UZD8_9MICO|nr:hypothetical protein [Ornithinimicrobium kibberense]